MPRKRRKRKRQPIDRVVYMATCITNGKCYIGKTSYGLKFRRQSHLRDARAKKKNMAFHCAIRKYGEDAFTWEVIATAKTEKQLVEKELNLINLFNTCDRRHGYNTSKDWGGGKLGVKKGPPTKETRRKISSAQVGRKISRETKISMSKKVNFRGEVISVFELSEKFGVPAEQICKRISSRGWSIERAVTTPLNARCPQYTVGGITGTISDLCRHFSLNRAMVQQRIRLLGWSVEKSIKHPRVDPQEIEFRGKKQTILEWSKEIGVEESTLRCRLKKGWSVNRSLTEKTNNTNQKIAV